MKLYKLHLVRHGITEGNLKGLYIGSGSDLPLCEEGINQLDELNNCFEYPNIQTVFTSPLLRAQESAKMLFPNAKNVFAIDNLREANFGIFEGQPLEELKQNTEFAKWMSGGDFTPEGAEPVMEFHARCADTLMKLFEFMIKQDIQEAACVTHGGVIMSMLSQRAVPTQSPEKWMADAGCGYTLQTDIKLWMRDNLVEVVDICPYGYLDAKQ